MIKRVQGLRGNVNIHIAAASLCQIGFCSPSCVGYERIIDRYVFDPKGSPSPDGFARPLEMSSKPKKRRSNKVQAAATTATQRTTRANGRHLYRYAPDILRSINAYQNDAVY